MISPKGTPPITPISIVLVQIEVQTEFITWGIFTDTILTGCSQDNGIIVIQNYLRTARRKCGYQLVVRRIRKVAIDGSLWSGLVANIGAPEEPINHVKVNNGTPRSLVKENELQVSQTFETIPRQIVESFCELLVRIDVLFIGGNVLLEEIVHPIGRRHVFTKRSLPARMMTVYLVFGGNPERDPDGYAAALEEMGLDPKPVC
jgi:hypothetical protein